MITWSDMHQKQFLGSQRRQRFGSHGGRRILVKAEFGRDDMSILVENGSIILVVSLINGPDPPPYSCVPKFNTDLPNAKHHDSRLGRARTCSRPMTSADLLKTINLTCAPLRLKQTTCKYQFPVLFRSRITISCSSYNSAYDLILLSQKQLTN